MALAPLSLPIGTPVTRSLEHSFQRVSLDPGPFSSVGYNTFIYGLNVDDLFAIPPGSLIAAVNESNARFSLAETGSVIRTIPNSPVPLRPGENNCVQTVIDAATHTVYFDPSPRRDWTQPATFRTGQVVAVYDTAETVFIDLVSRVGTSSASATLTFSKDFTLASGKPFNFNQLGTALIVDFQFQIGTGLISPDLNFPLVVVDSGVWRFAG